jgi:hypothetical protein
LKEVSAAMLRLLVGILSDLIRSEASLKAENTFYRYKRNFGPRLRARSSRAQRVEVMTACSMLNRISSLGMPFSQKLAA